MIAKKLDFIRTLIRLVYKGEDGYEIPHREEKRIKKTLGSPIYGEITVGSLDKLLAYLKLKQKDVFYDLGSGVGKVVLQTAMTTKAKCVGVELSKARFLTASHVLIQAEANGLVKPSHWVLRLENILKTDLSDATVVFTCSTAFPEKFMRQLLKKMQELKPGTLVASLREFRPNRYLERIDKLYLDMTWERKSRVNIYRRTDKERK